MGQVFGVGLGVGCLDQAWGKGGNNNKGPFGFIEIHKDHNCNFRKYGGLKMVIFQN